MFWHRDLNASSHPKTKFHRSHSPLQEKMCYSSCGTWWHTRRNQISSFPRKGRVHLNRWGRQFSWLLAVELCTSAWVMLDRPRSEVAWEYWLPTPFAGSPSLPPPLRHRVPSGSARALHLAWRVFLFIFLQCEFVDSQSDFVLATNWFL